MIPARMRSSLLVALLLLAAPGSSPAVKNLRMATLAPEGSSWMKRFRQWSAAIEKRAPAVRIKFFPGGVAGDERDAVRKMKLKALDGAAVTAIGLGLIQPEVRLLDLPFLIRSNAALDHVRTRLDAELRAKFEDKGFVLLFWGDVGLVHLFSSIPLDGLPALTRMRIWAWTDDPLVKALFSTMNPPLNSVPLGVPDVLGALQTGLIDACYGSYLSTLALQWHSKVKFVTSMSIGQSVGAGVLTRAAWDGLSKEEQQVVREESVRLGPLLLATVREDNQKALARMKADGLREVPTPDAVASRFVDAAASVETALEGKLYSRDFRLKVRALLAEFERSGGANR